MSGPDAIVVIVVGTGSPGTDNASFLSYDPRHAPQTLPIPDHATTIDLSCTPFSRCDRERLFAPPGEGEVQARFDVPGNPIVVEKAIASVRLGRQGHLHHEEPGVFIEISQTPSILMTPVADVERSAPALVTRLAG